MSDFSSFYNDNKDAFNAYETKSEQIQEYFLDESIKEHKTFISLNFDRRFLNNGRFGMLPIIKDWPRLSAKELFMNTDASFRYQLEAVKQRMEFDIDDFWLPGLWPDIGARAPHEAFSCRLVFKDENSWPWIEPVVKDVSDIKHLKFDFSKSDSYKRTIYALESWQSYTAGKLPVRFVCGNGPMDLATMIMDYSDFLIAMTTNPDEIHQLLDICTEAIIEFIDRQIPTIKNMWWGNWQYRLPYGKGVFMSNDSSVAISPQMHDEFIVPQLEKISKHFGGVYVHWCGGQPHIIKSLVNVDGLKGVDSQFNIEQVIEARKIIGEDRIITTFVKEGDTVGAFGGLSEETLKKYVSAVSGTRTIVGCFVRNAEEVETKSKISNGQ